MTTPETLMEHGNYHELKLLTLMSLETYLVPGELYLRSIINVISLQANPKVEPRGKFGKIYSAQASCIVTAVLKGRYTAYIWLRGRKASFSFQHIKRRRQTTCPLLVAVVKLLFSFSQTWSSKVEIILFRLDTGFTILLSSVSGSTEELFEQVQVIPHSRPIPKIVGFTQSSGSRSRLMFRILLVERGIRKCPSTRVHMFYARVHDWHVIIRRHLCYTQLSFLHHQHRSAAEVLQTHSPVSIKLFLTVYDMN